MLKRSRFVILTLVALTVVMPSVAQGPAAPAESASLDLLDRGAPAGGTDGPGRTHTTPMLMTGLLANLAGTPGVTMGAVMTFAPPAPPGVFHGYFFTASAALTMISPGGMFPTSYQPFFVTGAYVWGGPPIFGSPIVGAGVAPALGGMVGAFTAVPVTFGVFSPGMIFGAMTLFAHSPPAVSVPVGSGVACGFDPAVAGAVLGGLTPGTGGGKPVVAFAPGMTVTPIAAPPATYVAGCFIAGSMVPVELQSFQVD